MKKRLTVDSMKTMSIEEIINLYINGYRLENLPEILQDVSTGSITFVVSGKEGLIDQSFIYVDGIYRGISNSEGKLTVDDLTALPEGYRHTYVVVRAGYNARNGFVVVVPNVEVLMPVILTDATIGKGSIYFIVNAYGNPVEGAQVFVRDQEVGITSKDGTCLAEGLDRGVNVPFRLSKEGLIDLYGNIYRIDNRNTFTTGIIPMGRPGPNVPIVFTTTDPAGLPIPDVDIRVDGITGKTDNNGSFVADLDGTKSHTYTVSKTGYTTISGVNNPTDFNIIPIIMTS